MHGFCTVGVFVGILCMGWNCFEMRGKLDGIDELVTFADKLEKATIDTIESGTMTKDLALITTLENVNTVNSEDFIKAIRATLENLLNA